MTSLLPVTSTPLEFALDEQAERILAIPAPLRELWRWDDCPVELLPHLAWAMSVDLWSPTWPVERQREVIRDSFKLHRLKGTISGIRKYVNLVDATITRAIVPPQEPFWAPVDEAAIDRWESTLPQVRIYPRREPGVADGFYFDADFTDDDGDVPGSFYETNRASEDGGERIVFWRDGTETEIGWLGAINPTYGTHTQLGLPGTAEVDHAYHDEDYLDASYLPSRREADASVVTLSPVAPEDIRAGWYRVTRTTADFVDNDGAAGTGHFYDHDGGLDNGADIRLRQRRDRALGDAGLLADIDAQLVNDAADPADGDFYAGNEAPWQVYRRWFVFSPDVTPGDPDGWSYYDDFRYGMPHHTAELWVDLDEHAPEQLAYDTVGDFYGATDLSKLWQAANAIDLSKAYRDQVLIETELRRPVRFGDRRIFGSFQFGEYVPRTH